MVPPGRKRFGTHHPPHIPRDKIPERVEFITKGLGFWRMAYKDETTGKWRYKRLCGANASLGQLITAFETAEQAASQTHAITFKSLSLAFQKTLKWRELSPLTRDDYLFCHKKICDADTGKLPFGDQPITKWTTGTVLKYRDFRGEDSPHRANKELAYIKRVLTWARLYELITVNPAEKVPKLTVKPRLHYAEDKDYQFLLQIARESPYWYMAPLIIITYECGLRLCEALDLTDAAERPEGLRIVGRKGSNTNIIRWGENLKTAWDNAKAQRNRILTTKRIPQRLKPDERHIFISDRTGDRLTDKAVKTAKAKLDKAARAKAEQIGFNYTPFTLHDIKRKSVSDTKGDRGKKMDKSRHKSISMMQVYDVLEKQVNPTSED